MAEGFIELDGFRHDVNCTFAQMSDEEWIAADFPFCTCGPEHYEGMEVDHGKYSFDSKCQKGAPI
jgi:hypothetical protein